ncbi:MAG: BatD family protein, partial [Spirochaetota bacterium]
MTGRKWIHTVILLAASALCTTSLCAAQITTRLGRDRVYTGDTVLLEVYVEDARSVKPDTLPQLDNVEAGFAGTMRSLEIVNGRRTTYLVLRYTLRSDMPGTYTVPPFPILVDGSRMMTGEVTFT